MRGKQTAEECPNEEGKGNIGRVLTDYRPALSLCVFFLQAERIDHLLTLRWASAEIQLSSSILLSKYGSRTFRKKNVLPSIEVPKIPDPAAFGQPDSRASAKIKSASSN